MRVYIFVFSLFIIACSDANATLYESYLQANQKYDQGDYDSAYNQYLALPMNSFSILYNLGCIEYKRGNYYNALYAYLRARKYAVGKNILLLEQAYVRASKELNIAMPSPYSPAFALCVNYIRYIPLLLIQVIFLILVYFLILY